MGVTTKKYDILTRIAVGNGALVYRAVDKETTRQVALKLLVQDGDLDHRFNVDALLADAKKLTQITGAHVCHLLDAHTDEDGPVLIYEFADGITGTELPPKRKLEGPHALDIAAQLLSALRSGERQRCPHGDLKPSNIVFVDLPDGRLFTLVLDWGLAAHRTALPDDSLPFLSPERLAGGAASHSADLFSTGAILFFLFTGKLLVAGATREELRAAWQRARPAVLAEMRPDLPAKFVQWVCSLLELAPEKRPPSAVDAATTLATLNPPPPPTPPEAIRPRPQSGVQRPPAPLGLGKAKTPTESNPPRGPQTPATSPGPTKPTTPPAAPPPAPPKLAHVAMTLFLFLFLVALLSGAVWFVFFRKTEPAYLSATFPEHPDPMLAERPAPASVGREIGKKNTSPTPPLIAQDGFEANGSQPLDGMHGGGGWAGPWKGLVATVEGDSLESNDFPARGSSLVLPPTGDEMLLSREVGTLDKFAASPRSATWYFACLLQHGGGPTDAGGEVEINPFNGTDIQNLVRIVARNVGGALQLTLNDKGEPIEVKDHTNPVLIVLRAALTGSKGGKWDLKTELSVDPPAGSKWPPADAKVIKETMKSVELPPQLGLLIRKPAGTAATTRIDEIRFSRDSKGLFSRPPASAEPAPPSAEK